MSKLGQLKKLWEYKNSTPHCTTCVHYVSSFYKMSTNSTAKVYNHHCHRGGFTVRPHGICNQWTSKVDSAVLEKKP